MIKSEEIKIPGPGLCDTDGERSMREYYTGEEYIITKSLTGQAMTTKTW